jgi:hypothetical protein
MFSLCPVHYLQSRGFLQHLVSAAARAEDYGTACKMVCDDYAQYMKRSSRDTTALKAMMRKVKTDNVSF